MLAELTHEDVQQKLLDALNIAQDGYRETTNIAQNQRVSGRVVDSTKKKMSELYAKERTLRLKISATLQKMGTMGDQTASLLSREQRLLRSSSEERQQFVEFLRSGYTRLSTLDTGPVAGRVIVRRLLGTSLGESVDEDLRQAALTRARGQLMIALADAHVSVKKSQEDLMDEGGDVAKELTELQAEREKTVQELKNVTRTHDRAQQNLRLSESQLQEVQEETAAVQAEVMRMQGELARIDGRLRTRAERELIQKGLRADRPDKYKKQENDGAGMFDWPAKGPVSAGFHDASYNKFFGVAHQGIDIVVPQGTPVESAADGIVFLARDGGLRGFSYILIGHRDGYATLYGHLSSFSVKTGDDVQKGQVIGMSGGKPGTHGAGPMTTASHLHFEMLRYGEHVNPRPLLP